MSSPKQRRIPVRVKAEFILDATESFALDLRKSEWHRKRKVNSNCFMNYGKVIIDSSAELVTDPDSLLKIGRGDLITQEGEVVERSTCCNANVLYDKWGDAWEFCKDCLEPLEVVQHFFPRDEEAKLR